MDILNNIAFIMKGIQTKRVVSIVSLLFISFILFSQKFADNWLLLNNGLEFHHDSVIVRQDYAPHENRGAGIISDKNGELLFYTDGFTVWNNNHEKMPNGENLIINHINHSIHESLVIPKPNSDSLFYIFSVDPWNGQESTGLYYSIVDISLEGGLGDIILKGEKILPTVSNKITAVYHRNHRDVWLITHEYDTNKYYAYLVSETGVADTPVISSLGRSHTSSFDGQLKASPDGRKIACSHDDYSGEVFELFDFNDSSGELSNPMSFELPVSYRSCDGIEFSSDASNLFVYQTGSTGESGLYQFDLSSQTYDEINNSRVLLIKERYNGFRQMQLGPNGKIYITKGGGGGGSDHLGVIENPNEYGESCYVIENGLFLEGGSSFVARTPNFIQSYFFKTSFSFDNTCQASPIHFYISNDHSLDSVRWQFGEGSSSNSFYPEFQYSDTGNYTVELLAYYPEKVDTVIKQITINPFSEFDLGNDTTVCFGHELFVGEKYDSYHWNTSDTSQSIKIEDEGWYKLVVENSLGCFSADSIYLEIVELPVTLLPDSIEIGDLDSIQINPGDFKSYSWSTGETAPSIYVSEEGWYSVAVGNDYGCQTATSIFVKAGNQSGNDENTDWEVLNPNPSILPGRDVHFITDQIGFILTNVELLNTMDGGNTWEIMMDISSGSHITFKNSIGYIIGNNGSIYKSTHNGFGWNKLSVAFDDDLNAISLIHQDTILITSNNKLFVSHNGGQSWGIHNVNGVDIEDSYFTSATTGHVACRNGTILKTIDAGLNWYVTESVNSFPSDFFAIHFVSPEIGFASREHDDLLKTTDGGETWFEVGRSIDAAYSISFVNESVGYIAGEYGAIHKTVDGGINWDWVGFDGRKSGNNMYGIHFINENTGYCVGSSGRIIKTNNGGATWEEYAPSYNQIYQVAYTSPKDIYALGDKLYKSTDDGQSWDTLHTGVYDEGRYHYRYIQGQFFSANEFFVIASAGEISCVLKTTNGGESFDFIKSNNKNIRGTSMHFLNQEVGYVNNSYDSYWSGLHKTEDGGKTWEDLSGERFKEICFLDEKIGFALKWGDLYKTDDGGYTWEKSIEVYGDLNKITFANDSVGYISGDYGLVLKTLNRGKSWQELIAGRDDNDAIRFYNQNIGFVLGGYNALHKTINGGLTWETSRIPGNIQSISLSEDLGIYAAGASGLIMRKIFESDEVSAELFPVENQTDSEAVLSGIIASNGAVIRDIAFEYGLNLQFEHSINATPGDIEPDCTDSIISEISNLEGNKEYAYRIKWNYNNEVYNSDTLYFRTLPEYELHIHFMNPTDPSSTEITGKAISREKRITNIGFQYSADSSFSSLSPAEPGSIEGDTAVTIRSILPQLEHATTYFARIVASYNGEAIYSPIISFQTNPEYNIQLSRPYIQGADARIGAYITPYQDTMKNILFEYGTTFDYGKQLEALPNLIKKNRNMYVEAHLTNLDTNLVYYYRIKAEMGDGIIYSEAGIINFPGEILIIPMEVEQTSNNQIRMRAMVNTNGKSLYPIFFEFGENGELSESVQATPYYFHKYETEVIYAEVESLKFNTPYSFRVHAVESGNDIYSEELTFILNEPLSREDSILDSELNIFPNPANDYLIVKSLEQYDRLRIVDIQGQIMQDEVYHLPVDVSILEPGIYFITVQNQDKIKTGRFIKQ